jgi:hypothetical protein
VGAKYDALTDEAFPVAESFNVFERLLLLKGI